MVNRVAELLHPTFFSDDSGETELDRATAVANRVLRENGMRDFGTTQDHASCWKGYFTFRYFNIDKPSLAYGGGAALVVRAKDLLGGMVYCFFDWLEQDIDVLFANIPKAFSVFDAKAIE